MKSSNLVLVSTLLLGASAMADEKVENLADYLSQLRSTERVNDERLCNMTVTLKYIQSHFAICNLEISIDDRLKNYRMREALLKLVAGLNQQQLIAAVDRAYVKLARKENQVCVETLLDFLMKLRDEQGVLQGLYWNYELFSALAAEKGFAKVLWAWMFR